MNKIMREMVTDTGETSSARVINIGGFIIGSILLSYQTYQTGLTYDLFGVYMMYCSGTYGLSKYMDRKYRREDEYDTMADERFTQHSNGGNGSRIDNPDI